MKRLDRLQDQMNDTATYELPNGKWVTFDGRALREYGLAALMRAQGLEYTAPTERLPVFQYGRQIGTMAPDFDPMTAKSTSIFYDVRPGDFTREGDTWVVGRTMGASDVDCVAGFIRDPATVLE